MGTTEEKMKAFYQWSQKFMIAEKRQMNETEYKVFMGGILQEMNRVDVAPHIKEMGLYQLVEKRAQYLNLEISPHLLVLLSVIGEGRPGTMVMYIYACKAQSMAYPEGDRVITISRFGRDMFPDGWLDDKALQDMWDAQKVPGADNLLDMISGKDFETA